MVIKNGKFGKFAACPNYPKCKNTKTLNKDGTVVNPSNIEIADFKCEICGADVVIRNGQYGEFYSCSNYPKCKFTKTKTTEIGVKCPVCGDEIVSKTGKGNKKFYTCRSYPSCGFSSWDLPTEERCPDCGSILLKNKSGMLVCSGIKCKYKTKGSN